MFLKNVLLLILFWWGFRLARRLLSGGGVRHGRRTSAQEPQQKRDLSHLTQQEISDADFEEIP